MSVYNGGDEPAPKLGWRFWTAWGGAAALITGGFVALIMIAHRQILVVHYAPIMFLAIMWMLAMAPYMTMRMRGITPPTRAPQRRYVARFLPAMMVYTIVFLAALNYAQSAHPRGVLAWAVALAPAVPLLFAIRAVGLLVKEEDDEYTRAQTVSSYIWATNFTLTVCTIWGFLALFRLVPHLDLWIVFPIWAVGLVPPLVIRSWKK